MIINKAELYIFHNTDNRDCVDTKHRKLWIIKEFKFRMFDFQSKVSQKKAFCCHCRIVGDVNTLVRALFPATAHCAGRANSPSILEGDCASAAAVRCGREHSSRSCFSPFFNMRNLN